MRLDNGSFCFNMDCTKAGGTPSWGTALGQGEGYKLNRDGVEELLSSMLYCSISDVDKAELNLKNPEKNEIVVASLYKKVYVNEVRVPEAKFFMAITREKSGSHPGRMSLKYYHQNKREEQTYLKDNKACLEKIRAKLNLTENSAWFISDIYTKNQDELHFRAYVVDSEKTKQYANSQERGTDIDRILQSEKPAPTVRKESLLQKIYFGTPGSGKSYKADQDAGGKIVYRTTFHPDSDYASFVGCYKPIMSDDEIKYLFVPQVFTDAYTHAWQSEEDVYLVIEEINRGNCAQIFGDLFQLLDRDSEGYSDYRITADRDLRDYLVRELEGDHEGIKDGKLCLPPNLHIIATMNTSDQSLFPMDSAFKRRWDWEYVPVNYSEAIESGKFTITIGDKKYLWVNFLRRVNEEILKVTDSEDKQMGNFFIKSDVGEDEFKSKVMFYLWNEVCKDEYRTPNNFFRISQDSEFSFNDLYQTDGLAKLQGFMAYLGVEPITENTDQVVEEPIEA